jgi:hypothetical protein
MSSSPYQEHVADCRRGEGGIVSPWQIREQKNPDQFLPVEILLWLILILIGRCAPRLVCWAMSPVGDRTICGILEIQLEPFRGSLGLADSCLLLFLKNKYQDRTLDH